MATITTVLFLCITAVVINVCVVDSAHQTAAPAPAPVAECSTLIMSMADCLTYLTAVSTLQKPEGTCCSGLETMLKTDLQCLCDVFKNSAQLGLQLNTTKALALPATCNIKAPSPASCGINLGTTTAPVQSPMATGVAPTMAAFGPSTAVPLTPASQSSGSSGLAKPTISVFLSMLLSVYFYSYQA